MPDILQTALSALPQLLPHREVRYIRGAGYVDLEVTVGSTKVDYTDEHGVQIRSEIRDYLIKPALLIIDGSIVEPADGDKIVDTKEGATRTYQLMCVESGVPWRWTDRYHTMYRVHTRQVDEV